VVGQASESRYILRAFVNKCVIASIWHTDHVQVTAPDVRGVGRSERDTQRTLNDLLSSYVLTEEFVQVLAMLIEQSNSALIN
jgi:hypothetical protein